MPLHEKDCQCIEKGSNGLHWHSKGISDVVFVRTAQPYTRLRPCNNHVDNYASSEYWSREDGNATVTPEHESSSAKPSDTTPAKKTVIFGG